jgi:hypothetical protein
VSKKEKELRQAVAVAYACGTQDEYAEAMKAKRRFLERTNQYECCGIFWPNGSPCLGRSCPVQAELDRIKKLQPRYCAPAQNEGKSNAR